VENVPFLDLGAQYAPIAGEVRTAIDAVLMQRSYVLGPAVEAFERAFATYCEAGETVALGSGTDALHLALLAHGVGPGDEVITQANTFVATLEAIAYCGARPILVDVREPDYAIDVAAIEAAITPRTKAIVPVHLFGQPAPMDEIDALAARCGVAVIEDASQAHGARYRGRRVGARGTACWSFYPGKNLGAYGEGGAVTTNDAALARTMRLLRSHGSERRYVHEMIGYNYRMDGIQGAVLGVKLPYLDGWNAGRRAAAARYDALLSDVERPHVPADVEHVYHIYPVFVDERDRVREALMRAGIETNVHYPGPCHLQPAFASLGYARGDFPHSEMIAERELSLPMYAELTAAQQERVVDALLGASTRSIAATK
jgi:dTDP-4-amino-4,6-dideoxygalactose transaminase